MIIKGAEPFFLPGGPHGVLLIHGFTGMPAEMLLLGRYLQEKGFTVLCMRLAGHGTTPEDMAHTDAEDWFDSVCDGYAILSGCTEKISVVGHSMGGLMALMLSAQKEIYRTVTLAAPIFITEERGLQFLPSRGEALGKYVPKRRRRLADVPPACNVTYRKMPLISVHELVDFIEETKKILPQVRQPLLIVQSPKDHTVQARSADYLYEKAGSDQKEIFWLKESGHLVTIDCERELVFARTAKFLAE